MKLTTEKINELFGVDDSWKAPDRLMKILFDRERREKLFREFLTIESDVSYDWFYQYFQDEAADRVKKKQDFTPVSVSRVLSTLIGHDKGTNYDCAAGTGGLTIQKWQHDRMQYTPMDYFPSDHFYHCEDLSDRAIPFLLFNLIIRGVNACVVHCDVLTREARGAFFIQNDNDDALQFSSLNVIPYTDANARELGVNWKDQRYLDHIESPEVPLFLEDYEKHKIWKDHQHKIAEKLKKITYQIEKGATAK
ncbi:N-6 DNA methylase [Sporolactobacillus sp. CQH2019]|uniref:N-6 DNA methylase n=1 Tax=Sporolactobacillus sp. CQH2019 TaxID=3023512 RepID=UPI002367B68D|nr:N-6 DNA methylase [Sporolactobacillus sp. CQH2019]MDD9148143.1 N-6 DNA methylase [Sporolactobacillus sp. CQH2019]